MSEGSRVVTPTRLPVKQTKSLEMVADASKQVVALSTAIVAFMVTFVEKFGDPKAEPLYVLVLLWLAWAAFLGAIWLGVRTLWLSAAQAEAANPTIVGRPIQPWVQGQMTAFKAGLLLTVIYGIAVLYSPRVASQASQNIQRSNSPICGEQACDIVRKAGALGPTWNGCRATIGRQSDRGNRAVWVVSAFSRDPLRRSPSIFGVDATSGTYIGADPPHVFRVCPEYPKCDPAPTGCKSVATTD